MAAVSHLGSPSVARTRLRHVIAAVLFVATGGAAATALGATAADAQGTAGDGLLYLDTYARGGDPSTLGPTWDYEVTGNCVTGSFTLQGNVAESFDYGSYETYVINEKFDADGNLCVYTATPLPVAGYTPFPATVDFHFDEYPDSEANVSFSMLGAGATGDIVIGKNSFDIYEYQYDRGNWPSSDGWTHDTLPALWQFSITSPCLAEDMVVDMDPINRNFFSGQVELGGFTLLDTNNEICTYVITDLGDPGWVTKQPYSVPYTPARRILPNFLVSVNFTAVKVNPPLYTCGGLAVTVYLEHGDLPTGGSNVIRGTEGDDEIKALGGNDTICGLGGDDRINGGYGNDRIIGGNGNDWLIGNKGNDWLSGGLGNDVLLGRAGEDVLGGGGGNDYLGGGKDDDRLSGAEGNDFLLGNMGDDRLNGGDGTDTCDGRGGIDIAYSTCETKKNIP